MSPLGRFVLPAFVPIGRLVDLYREGRLVVVEVDLLLRVLDLIRDVDAVLIVLVHLASPQLLFVIKIVLLSELVVPLLVIEPCLLDVLHPHPLVPHLLLFHLH